MRTELHCRSALGWDAAGAGQPGSDDSELEIDVTPQSGTVRLSGTLGPRSAATLRAVLHAMDDLAAPIRVDGAGVDASDEHVGFVLREAARRRRALGLPDVSLDAASVRILAGPPTPEPRPR